MVYVKKSEVGKDVEPQRWVAVMEDVMYYGQKIIILQSTQEKLGVLKTDLEKKFVTERDYLEKKFQDARNQVIQESNLSSSK